jgi:hypothetical protein
MWFPSESLVARKFSIYKWSDEWPTTENKGDWFFMLAFGKLTTVEITVHENGEIYLSEPCNNGGFLKQSFGTMLRLYRPGTIQFCGPIQMPPDYKKRN